MADFYWKARTLDGVIQSGTIAAKNQNEVISLLRRKKLTMNPAGTPRFGAGNTGVPLWGRSQGDRGFKGLGNHL